MSQGPCGVCWNTLTGWCLLMRGTSKAPWRRLICLLMLWGHRNFSLPCLMALCSDQPTVLRILPTPHVCLFFFTSRCVFVMRGISLRAVLFTVWHHSQDSLLPSPSVCFPLFFCSCHPVFLATHFTFSLSPCLCPRSLFNQLFWPTYTRLWHKCAAQMQNHKIALLITFPPL